MKNWTSKTCNFLERKKVFKIKGGGEFFQRKCTPLNKLRLADQWPWSRTVMRNKFFWSHNFSLFLTQFNYNKSFNMKLFSTYLGNLIVKTLDISNLYCLKFQSFKPLSCIDLKSEFVEKVQFLCSILTLFCDF